MEPTGTSRAPIGASLVLAGGALLLVGSFLPWAEVSGGGQSVTASGIDGSDGYLTIAAGLAALVAGFLLMRQAKRGLAILAIVAGLLGAGLGIYDATTAKDNVLDAAAEELAPTVPGATVEQVREILDAAIDAGQFGISISIGLYVVIGGGVLALIGGLLSMKGSDTAATSGFATASAPVPPAESSPSAATPPTPPSSEPPPLPPEGGAS